MFTGGFFLPFSYFIPFATKAGLFVTHLQYKITAKTLKIVGTALCEFCIFALTQIKPATEGVK